MVSVRLGGNSQRRPTSSTFSRSGVFQDVVGDNVEMRLNFNDGVETRPVSAVATTKNYFTALGIPMAHGRGSCRAIRMTWSCSTTRSGARTSTRIRPWSVHASCSRAGRSPLSGSSTGAPNADRLRPRTRAVCAAVSRRDDAGDLCAPEARNDPRRGAGPRENGRRSIGRARTARLQVRRRDSRGTDRRVQPTYRGAATDAGRPLLRRPADRRRLRPCRRLRQCHGAPSCAWRRAPARARDSPVIGRQPRPAVAAAAGRELRAGWCRCDLRLAHRATGRHAAQTG